VFLQKIVSETIYQAQRDEKNKIIAISEAIEKLIIKEKNIKSLFDEVSTLIKLNLDETLFFEISSGGSKATTLEDSKLKKIFITLREDISEDEIQSVLVHELGEADYLARKLPIAFNVREDELHGRIIELFSHPHCRRLAEIFGLEEVEGLYRNNANDICIHNHNEKSKYDYGWQKLLGVAWYLLTYPDLWEFRKRLATYCEFADTIDEICEIVNNTDTMSNDINLVEESMQRIINVLHSVENSNYKLPDYIIMKSRK